jgi:diguanylate cyclase (GGDEF)-like protein
MVLAAWIIALPLVAHQSVSFFGRIYRNLELHLENERELSTRLFRQSTTDALTGLPNRLLFYDRLARALARAGRNQTPVALFFIDLDRFKHVNESLGHEGGDRILQVMAGKLVENLRGHDTICRIGGDEFLAFATDLGDIANNLPPLAQRLVEELSCPIRVGGQDVVCTASVGVSVYPLDGQDVSTLVKHADHAMSVAKERGRSGYVLFRPEMQAAATERGMLEAELRAGLTRGELFLEYQPQVDATTSSVVGAEALVRWRHPQRGRLGPDAFIPLAEDSSLIIQVDRWVLRTGCSQLARWHKAGFDNLVLSVNLSARNFYRGDLVDVVDRTLREHGLSGKALEIEITESTLMTKVPGAVEVLRRLRGLGVSVSIDDFGTGYSALGYLNRFPVDALKIDRSLVLDVWSSAGAAAITTAVVAIGKSLNLRVVAEGVETEAQLAFLRKQGCHLIQGFLFSRPLEAEAFERLLRSPQPLPAAPRAERTEVC